MKREEWMEALRSYKGVKFLHQGRSRAGIDCVGLLACAASDLGLPNEVEADLRVYERAPDSGMFKKRIVDFLDPLPYNRLQPLLPQVKLGDVFAFWVDRIGFPRHVAVFAGVDKNGQAKMLHAYAKAPKRVVEHTMDYGFWLNRIDSLWRLPQIED